MTAGAGCHRQAVRRRSRAAGRGRGHGAGSDGLAAGSDSRTAGPAGGRQTPEAISVPPMTPERRKAADQFLKDLVARGLWFAEDEHGNVVIVPDDAAEQQ